MDNNSEKTPETPVKALNEILPKTLDDIIQERRDCARMYLTTEDELAAVNKTVSAIPTVKDQVNDWRFVTLYTEVGGPQITLLGMSMNRGGPRVTSQVLAVDFETKLVKTDNSYYRLIGEQGKGEPPIPHLLHVCYSLHVWGIGKRLGVLEVFY